MTMNKTILLLLAFWLTLPACAATFDRRLDLLEKEVELLGQKVERLEGNKPASPPAREPQTFQDIMKETTVLKIDASAQALGPADAPIVIVVFTELMCPFCSRHHQMLRELIAEYEPGTIRMIYLSRLVHGKVSGYFQRATLAAGEQGKFWEFNDEMFATRNDWSRLYNNETFADAQEAEAFEKVIRPKAEKLGLDVERLREDLADRRLAGQIRQENEYALSLNVTGVPTTFINGHKILGAKDKELFKKVIDALLDKSKNYAVR